MKMLFCRKKIKFKSILIIAFFLIVNSLEIPIFAKENAQPKIKLVFRYDDFHLKPTQLNYTLLNIFKKHNIPLCLGVIPYKDDDLIFGFSLEQLKDFRQRIKNGEIEIALHGYNHKDNGINNKWYRKNYKSEFESLEYKKQFARIDNAKSTLQKLLNCQISVFIPPWDSYDQTTLQTLADLNFTVLSSNLNGKGSSDRIKYIPAINEDIFNLISLLESQKGKDIIIPILFHPYDFTNENLETTSQTWQHMNKLDSILTFVKSQSYIETYSFQDLNKTNNFNSEYYQAHRMNDIFLFRLVSLKYKYVEEVLKNLNVQKRSKMFFVLSNIAFHLLMFFSVFFLTYFFSRKLKINPKMLLAVDFLISLPIIIFLTWFSESPAFITLLILFSTFLIAFNLAIAYYCLKKKQSLLRQLEPITLEKSKIYGS